MGFGARSVFYTSMASGGTLSSGYDLGRTWRNVYLEVPSMVSGTDLYIQAAASAGTYNRVQFVGPATVSYSVSIASAITITGAIDLGEGATNPYLIVPSLATGTSILVHGSLDNSSFRRITLGPTAASLIATDWAIATIAVATQRAVPLPVGFRYIKVELGTGVTDATSTWKVLATLPSVQQDFVIPSHTSQRFIPIPMPSQYMKVELSTAATATALRFNVVCAD